MTLINLNQLYSSLNSSVRSLNTSECVLSPAGKDFILRIFTANGYSDVSFEQSTTVFTDESGRIQFCPNQYFRLVPFGFEYYKALSEYKRIFTQIDNKMKELRSVSSSVLKDLRNTDVMNLPADISETIDSELSSENYTNQEIMYFKTFICNYGWWFGSKDISRGDFYNSPLLTLLNVVHSDNGFYMKLIPIFDSALNQSELTDLLGVEVRQIFSPNDDPEIKKSVAFSEIGKNLIVYGAPGTGKSHKIGQLSRGYTVMTTTFHSEYSYSDFVGSFRPFPLYQKSSQSNIAEHTSSVNGESEYFDASGNRFTRGRPFIDYRFVAGDLLRILTRAIRDEQSDSSNHYVLVIEELNRGNAAAIFGDFFQLLDRDSTGKSKYSIMNGDVVNYLKETLGESFLGNEVYIPRNLSIFATMNSADQGVFPLDTAFKRRWNYEYLRINYSAIEHGQIKIPYAGGEVTFKNFMETINENLSTRLQVHEDKLLGSYFISPEELNMESSNETEEHYVQRLKDLVSNKILMYLWDDVARYQRESIFKKTVTFGDIIHQYKTGEQIFTFDLPIELTGLSAAEESEGYDIS